jgi:hypothetical protein
MEKENKKDAKEAKDIIETCRYKLIMLSDVFWSCEHDEIEFKRGAAFAFSHGLGAICDDMVDQLDTASGLVSGL